MEQIIKAFIKDYFKEKQQGCVHSFKYEANFIYKRSKRIKNIKVCNKCGKTDVTEFY